MKLRGVTSVLAAGVAVSLVWLVGASGDEQPLEAIPAPAAIQAPPAPGPDRALESVRQAFGEEFADPLGAEEMLSESYELDLPGDEFLTFDPHNAPTPEVIQPDGSTDAAVLVPLPTAPATIATTTVESVGEEKKGALLSQPVKGRSTSKFGMRFHPVLRVYKLHTGHDWAAPCGTPVGAAAAGTVVRTGWAGGNGVQVKIDHGTIKGYRVVTTYNHLSSIGVKVGQQVKALQGIGRVGTTGYSTGCHLHFELIVNGQFTNPLPWLNGEATVVDLSQMDNVIVPTLTPTVQPTLPPASDQPTLPSLPADTPTLPTTPTGSPTPNPGTTEGTDSPQPGIPSGAPTPTPTTPTAPAPTTPAPGTPTTPVEPPAPDPETPSPTEPPSTPAEPTTLPTQTPTEPSEPPTQTPTTPPPPPPTTTTPPPPSPPETAPEPTQTTSSPAQQPDPPPTVTESPADPPSDG